MSATQALDFYCDPTAPAQPDQLAAEFAELLELYRALDPDRVLEIGVRGGGSLYQWIKHANRDALFVAVEIGMGAWGNKTMPDPIGWHKWAEDCGSTLIPVIGDSHHPDIVRRVRQFGPYDFVFIDADHSYYGISCDWLAFSGMVRPGGIVAIHDILRNREDDKIEVWRYWPLIQGAHRTQELISGEKQRTRGIGVVYV